MTATVYVGLAVTSEATGTITTATFDQETIAEVLAVRRGNALLRGAQIRPIRDGLGLQVVEFDREWLVTRTNVILKQERLLFAAKASDAIGSER